MNDVTRDIVLDRAMAALVAAQKAATAAAEEAKSAAAKATSATASIERLVAEARSIPSDKPLDGGFEDDGSLRFRLPGDSTTWWRIDAATNLVTRSEPLPDRGGSSGDNHQEPPRRGSGRG